MVSTSDFVFNPKTHRFIDDKRGGLTIWRQPTPGKLYLAGIDSSSGQHGGDFACLSMLETETRALVATWHGRYDASDWGKMCCRLGAYYNHAMLAFETHPSQHGLAACLAARNAHYQNIFVRVQIGTVSRRRFEQLGWATTSASKGVLWNRIRVAINDGNEIPDKDLLRQLLEGKIDIESGRGEIVFGGHDDRAISYGIAQCVCDIVANQGYVTPLTQEPKTYEEAWWQSRKAEWSQAESGVSSTDLPAEDLHDGS